MTIRFPIEPRLVPPEKVARRLGVSYAMFKEKLPELNGNGFPKPEPVLGNYCLQAVDRWIDARAGLTPVGTAVSDPAQIMERVRAKAWAK